MRTFILSLFALLLLAACGDDVINHYYTQEPETPPTEEEKPQVPPFEPDEWITDIQSLCFYGVHPPEDKNSLFPAWLLQAEGMKRAYADSEFAQKFITDGIAIYMRNPGAGTRITLRMSQSPLCHASEQTIIVPDGVTSESLELEYPVQWNFRNLLNWKEEEMVNLEWSLLLDGVEVDRTFKTFNCHSLYQMYWKLISHHVTDKDEVEAIKQTHIGSYPVKESDEFLTLHNLPFYMGYINEKAPILNRLKKEVIEDGYLPFLYGYDCNNTTDLINCTARAFNYLTIKYRIDYLASPAQPQYLHPIEDVFSHRLGNHEELSLAFAAWCYSMGVNCFVEQTPNNMLVHVENRIEGNTFPVSPGEITMVMYSVNDLAELPKEEQFEEADHHFEHIHTATLRNEEECYKQDRIDYPWEYCRINVDELRGRKETSKS